MTVQTVGAAFQKFERSPVGEGLLREATGSSVGAMLLSRQQMDAKTFRLYTVSVMSCRFVLWISQYRNRGVRML